MEQQVSRYQETLDSPRKAGEEDSDRVAPSLPSGPVPTIPPPPLLFALLLTLRAKTKDADAKGEALYRFLCLFLRPGISEQELLAYHPSSPLRGGHKWWRLHASRTSPGLGQRQPCAPPGVHDPHWVLPLHS